MPILSWDAVFVGLIISLVVLIVGTILINYWYLQKAKMQSRNIQFLSVILKNFVEELEKNLPKKDQN